MLRILRQANSAVSPVQRIQPLLMARYATSSPNSSDKKQPVNDKNKTLVYMGPITTTIRSFKFYGLIFSGCGLISIPFLLNVGAEPLLGATGALTPTILLQYLTCNYVTKVSLCNPPGKAKRKHGYDDNQMLAIETLNFFGKPKETVLRLGDLRDDTRRFRFISWKNVGPTGRKNFFIEREIFKGDPTLSMILNRIESNTPKRKQSSWSLFNV
ncbi:hypothetical protein K493DRAFT_101377 [Basidiobolus meristosporus CBS 931.73]|uniref:Uncharacterized protein n=1 Tax=Basidiobolus meristosporus CBS 931.73 TaxID=1314790 RepID=A0A1Y1ZB02_9FUNG|nr:hypothetical protein K493DRAFT_101377 [Basidiobolus meristosporus CBS 931.73]|eukprot:ORY07461.1 hypothetical protein K493DRAFT_101377 [Basidiobolus meristosporus CBS 931.73]